MRKIVIFLLFMFQYSFAQTHVVYISEPRDSMALINQEDINIINKVFHEKAVLDSLYNINEKLIFKLESQHVIKDSIIQNQTNIINNNDLEIELLKNTADQLTDTYNKELRKEKNKKLSFEALTGASLIVIILLILI